MAIISRSKCIENNVTAVALIPRFVYGENNHETYITYIFKLAKLQKRLRFMMCNK